MIARKSILQCLPLLASVLGRKYGVQVHIGGSSAYTDGTRICLPSLPLQADNTFLGLVRGYLDHEAAHIRFTDLACITDATPLEKHIWNILEDWRVEQKLAALYPGCRRNYKWLIRHLFSDSSNLSSDPCHQVLNWILLTIRSWDVPELEKHVLRLTNSMNSLYPSLVPALTSILDQFRANCSDSERCLLYARDIIAVLTALSTIPSIPGENSSERESLRKLLSMTESELPREAEEMVKERLEAEVRLHPKRLGMAEVGEKKVKPLTREEEMEGRKLSCKLRNRFHALLQSSTMQRTRPSSRGKLDPARLYRLALNDSRVFTAHEERQSMNTAVHILFDCSGSMMKCIKLARVVCWLAASSLDAVGANVGVTAFPAEAPSMGATCSVYPIIRHGERVHRRFGISAKGQTPLGEALWWLFPQLIPLPEKRKIILIITDGDPDNAHCVDEALRQARNLGMELYGLGIRSKRINDLLPGRSRVISSIREFAPALYGLLQSALRTS